MSRENQDFRVMKEEAFKEQDREKEQPKQKSEVKAKVRFFGNNIGFQFSQTSNGSRTRKARVTKIHKATDDELTAIREEMDADIRLHKFHKSKGHCRGVWATNDEDFTTWVGESNWTFRGESERRVKVACVQFHGRPLNECRWESFESIYDREFTIDGEKVWLYKDQVQETFGCTTEEAAKLWEDAK